MIQQLGLGVEVGTEDQLLARAIRREPGHQVPGRAPHQGRYRGPEEADLEQGHGYRQQGQDQANPPPTKQGRQRQQDAAEQEPETQQLHRVGAQGEVVGLNRDTETHQPGLHLADRTLEGAAAVGTGRGEKRGEGDHGRAAHDQASNR